MKLHYDEKQLLWKRTKGLVQNFSEGGAQSQPGVQSLKSKKENICSHMLGLYIGYLQSGGAKFALRGVGREDRSLSIPQDYIPFDVCHTD